MSAQPDTRNRILEAARDLIYASSYADVGVQAICDRAGVKKGSFYHFFRSKQELTLAVIDHFFSDFRDSLIREAFDSDLPPPQRFERLIALAIARQEMVHRETGHVLGCPFGNLATEMATSDETIRGRIETVFSRLQGYLRDALRDGIERGDFPPLDVEATAAAMFAYFEGLMLLAKTRNDPAVLRELLPAMTGIRIPLTH